MLLNFSYSLIFLAAWIAIIWGVRKLRSAANGDPAETRAPKSEDRRLQGSFWAYFAVLALFTLALVLTVLVAWGSTAFSTSLESLISTAFGSTQGTPWEVLANGLRNCLPPILIGLAAVGLLVFWERRKTKAIRAMAQGPQRETAVRRHLRLRRLGAAVVCLFMVGSLLFANDRYHASDYVLAQLTDSNLYETRYVDPGTAAIVPPERPANLLYIYLESMESTYASVKVGGAMEENLIPNMTRLARENVSFSQTDKPVGGAYAATGTDWTMAAIYSTSSGAHFALPAGGSESAELDAFASGLVTIGDVLAANGYQNVFLCGSDATFSGLDAFFHQHGSFTVMDHPSLIARGDLPEDYHEWWGFEDAKLYEFAKEELTRLSQSGQPFNLTMVTADTHFPEGYICPLCPEAYDDRASNVIACADRQLGDFIAWCREQDFFENTVIVITGDHPRMDNVAGVDQVPWEQRGVYNCFINARASLKGGKLERHFTAMDIYPTTLSALGFTIPGDGLGLGVDLFSGRPTLAEELGYEALDSELEKHSPYYIPHLAPELLDG